MPRGRVGNQAHVSKISIHPKQYNEENQVVKSYPDSELRVLQVADMICEGKSRETCIKYVMDVKGITATQAKYYYDAAVNYLMPDDLDKYQKQMMAKNFKRLEKIVERGMKDDADLRLAKEAIAELNRMCGIGGNKVTMARNKEGEELIQITFD